MRPHPHHRLGRLAAQLRPAPIPAADADDPPLYTASVPVFLHYLNNLKAILGRVRGRELLLHAQLAPDMMNAATQMHVCANYSLRIAFPLAGKPVPDREGGPEGGPDAYRLPPLAPFSSTDAADIEARIDAVLAALRSLAPADFVGAESRPIRHSAGPAELTQPGADFLHLYGMPNFFFHLSMAYANLRGQGLEIGKADFDGHHVMIIASQRLVSAGF